MSKKATGHVRQRANGLWEGQYVFQKERRSIYGQTKEDVTLQLEAILKSIETGEYVRPNPYTLNSWLCEWLETYAKPSLRPTTFISYESMIARHFSGSLGKTLLSNISTRAVQNFFNEKLQGGRCDSKAGGLSAKTLKNIKHMLHVALEHAYYTLSSSDKTDTDAIVTQIANAYEENGDEVKRIVVKNEPEGDDLLWFIAIYSVANEQDLRRMDSEEARKMYADRLMYSASLDGTTLEITFSKVNPEKWMRQLEFDEESKKWARALHETLSESHALDQFRDQFADATPSYSGLTGYTGEGGYEHGDSYDNEIDISGFISPETKNSHDLAAYAIQAWENNWGYVWGTFGGVLTPALFTYKLQQYPDGVGNYRDYIQENYVGRRTTDCIGLIKGYCWLDTESMMINYATNGAPDWDADSYYNYAVSVGADHGPMSTIPDIPGLGLWQNGHAGVYIGGGYAVEAIGTKFGVVKTAIANRTWSAWYKIPFIDYDTNTLSDSDF